MTKKSLSEEQIRRKIERQNEKFDSIRELGGKCIYQRATHNWVTQCGMRAAYNRFWIYCPYCGKRILNLARASEIANAEMNE